jgi:pyruvate dehydrogenase E1 component alpha subunit
VLALAEREGVLMSDDLLRVIPNVGETDDRPLPDCLDEAIALELYRRMVMMRTYDERSLVYHRHGRIGTYAIYWGHEAMQVGGASALDASDWIVPSYRESAIGLNRGMDPANILAWWRGHPAGWWDPTESRVASISIPVGSHVPHAVGLAWGERLQGRNTVAIAYFGDGATSEGDFHEGANFAAVMNLPVVLFCNNNGWAITTPISKQTKAERLVDKAVGYGMRGVRVDGNDVLAVFQAVHEAAEWGRAGNGPTFIEAVSYRADLHATADDPTRYREDGEAQRARANDCLARFDAYLRRNGILNDATAEQIKQEALDAMAVAIATAEALPVPGPEMMFDPVYAQRTAAFERDLAELKALLDANGGVR